MKEPSRDSWWNGSVYVPTEISFRRRLRNRSSKLMAGSRNFRRSSGNPTTSHRRIIRNIRKVRSPRPTERRPLPPTTQTNAHRTTNHTKLCLANLEHRSVNVQQNMGWSWSCAQRAASLATSRVSTASSGGRLSQLVKANSKDAFPLLAEPLWLVQASPIRSSPKLLVLKEAQHK